MRDGMNPEIAGEFLGQFVRSSLQAALIALLVWGLIRLLGRSLAPTWRCALWMLVVLRVAWPFSIPSPFSIFNGTRWLSKVTWIESASAILDRFVSHPVTLFVWASVAFILLVRILCGALYTMWRLQDARPLDSWSAWWMLQECKEFLGITTPIAIYQSNRIQSPCIMGVLSPRLVIPYQLDKTLTPEELRLVLFHELAHVRRCDTALNWVLAIVEALHWFNPFIRHACNRIRDEREHACDVTALEAQPGSNRTYGEVLIRLVSTIRTAPRSPYLVGFPGDNASPDALMRRIRAIATFEKRRHLWMVGTATLLLVLALTWTEADGGSSDSIVGNSELVVIFSPVTPLD